MPTRLLSLTTTAGELVPAWFTDRDRPWLRDLLAAVEALDGRPISALPLHWRRSGRDPRGGPRLDIARHVLTALLQRTAAAPSMAKVRLELFAAASSSTRDEAMAQVAARHGLTVAALTDRLFADLPHARRIAWPRPAPEATWFGLLANLALAQGVLRHAHAAELTLEGASRAVLKTAWLHGASFAVVGTNDAVRLGWRVHDRGHARGLAAIAPVLPWARRFMLRAHCRIRDLGGTFVLATHDPILPGPEPRLFDSDLEREFARDWQALGTEWRPCREPAPLAIDGRLHFPDFALTNDAGDTWLLEIAGLRDPRALPGRLAVLAHEPRYLLCMPRRLVPVGWASHPRIVPFGRRVAAGEVLLRVARPWA